MAMVSKCLHKTLAHSRGRDLSHVQCLPEVTPQGLKMLGTARPRMTKFAALSRAARAIVAQRPVPRARGCESRTTRSLTGPPSRAGLAATALAFDVEATPAGRSGCVFASGQDRHLTLPGCWLQQSVAHASPLVKAGLLSGPSWTEQRRRPPLRSEALARFELLEQRHHRAGCRVLTRQGLQDGEDLAAGGASAQHTQYTRARTSPPRCSCLHASARVRNKRRLEPSDGGSAGGSSVRKQAPTRPALCQAPGKARPGREAGGRGAPSAKRAPPREGTPTRPPPVHLLRPCTARDQGRRAAPEGPLPISARVRLPNAAAPPSSRKRALQGVTPSMGKRRRHIGAALRHTPSTRSSTSVSTNDFARSDSLMRAPPHRQFN